MSNQRSKFHEIRSHFRTVRALPGIIRSPLPRGASAAIATLFLGLAISVGVGLARDYHRQSELRANANQKRVLMLVGEVELGNAVQDLKDCLLRNEGSYCEDCERHIQVLERTIAFYEGQGTQRPEELKVLAAVRRALSDYASAVVTVRDMQSRHMTIREIDAAVKGVDRPIAADLRELARLSDQRAEWRLSLTQALLMTICTLLGAHFAFLSFPISSRVVRAHPQSSPPLLPQLSSRILEWDDARKASAFLHLHDGVCQSLSGIMYFLKSAQLTAAVGVPESVIPSLQEVIQDTRAVALQLRPPKMEEAGLLATLQSLWIDARSLNAALVIKPRVLVDEADIPEELKPILLRIARMSIDRTGQAPAARVLWNLSRSDDTLHLSIQVAGGADGFPCQPAPPTGALTGFDAIQAVVMLSGGSLDRVRNDDDSKTVVCSWPLADSRSGNSK